MTLPKQLSDMFSSFNKFYENQFKGKRLDVVHEYGRCELVANYTKTKQFSLDTSVV